MTVLVGVKCSDGVIIGADSIATSALGVHRIVQIPSDKITIVDKRLIVAGTGSVGLGQRFAGVVQKKWNDKQLKGTVLDVAKLLSKAGLEDFVQTGIHMGLPQGVGFGSLFAGTIESIPQLVEFAPDNFQPEIKKDKIHFVTMGSGQALADPFLAFISRVLWKGQVPDVKTAMFGVYWALDHTIKYAPGGVGPPIRIATLTKMGGDWTARLLEEEELQETAQHIEAIEARISEYPGSVISEAKATPPPKPPGV